MEVAIVYIAVGVLCALVIGTLYYVIKAKIAKRKRK